jgi:serine/threonine-protein kinase
MQAHVQAPVPRIRERRPDVPQGLAVALERMLAKHREGRFASPADAARALGPFAAGAELAGLCEAPPRSAIPAA